MILVTGATGHVGSELVSALARAGAPVRAFSRSAASADLPTGAEGVSGDLNSAGSVAAALDGVRAVFLMPGHQQAHESLAAMRAAGVERVVLLSGASVPGGDTSNAVTRYMTEAETAVRESGLPWTFLRPFSFMSNTLEWAEALRAGSDTVRAPFAGARSAVVDPRDIAAVAALALTGSGHEGRAYTLSGPEALLPADRARILGEVLGRTLRFEALSDEEARAVLEARMPVEYVDAFFGFFAEGTLDESPVLPAVGDLTGRPPRTFAQWAQAHADAFRGAAAFRM
ncbi:NAD(P)H-binding protein [Streptomyces sp. NPDC006678]|uniref:NAD(P)H-binding protein n=1 Tax=Streptomyces sp. NPDC006678 TaxID=3157185 RepID=UPI0033EDC321